MKKFMFFLLVIIFSSNLHIFAQFSSVKDGDWRDPLTWSTDPNATAIPDSNSSVLIQHYVTASSTAYVQAICRDLTISAGAVLSNYSSAWVGGSVRVKQNVINYGTISPSYDFDLYIEGNFINYGITTKNYISQYQRLYVMGDIINYGSFHFTHTNFSNNMMAEFKVQHDHHIRSFNDSTIFLGDTRFYDSLGTIIIDSVAYISCNMQLKGSKILLPTPILYPKYLVLDNATISGGTIEANQNWITTKEGSLAYFQSIYGDSPDMHIENANLNGNFRSGGTSQQNDTNLNHLFFDGTTLLYGNIADWYSSNVWSAGNRGIFINGNFTNNGTIFDATTGTGYGLYLNQLDNSTFQSQGNLTNKGFYFEGNCSFSASDSISTTEFMAVDSNTVLNITSGDIIFKDKTVNVDFKGGTLNLPEGSNFFTTYQWYNTLQNIYLNANNSRVIFAVVGQNCTINNVVARLIYFSNNTTLRGKTVVPEDGHLFPAGNTYPRVLVENDITNYGRIENQQISGSLYLDILADITHDGKSWKNAETKLIGTQNQSINIPNDSAWTGKVIFDAMIEGTSYQWYKDNTPIDNATERLLTLQNGISKSDYGQYYCNTSSGNSRTITISGVSREVVIMEQHFDSLDELADWTVVKHHDTQTWMIGNINDHNFNTIDPTSLSSAMCPYINEDQDEYLITPKFSLGEGNASVEFYSGYNSEWLTNAKLILMLVTNNGQDWNQIWEFDATTNGWEWKNFSVDLTPYSNQSDIQLAFEYIGNDGDYVALDNMVIKGYEYITDVNDDNNSFIPNQFSLNQNYPNPFNPTTVISYQIPANSFVELKIFDMLGREVSALVNEEQSAGTYSLQFDASNLASGIYLYAIKAGDFYKTKKMILLK